MNIRIISLIIIIISAGFFSCVKKVSEYSDFSNTLQVFEGDDIILKFKANHVSGYEWFEKAPIDTNFLTLKLIDYKPDDNGQDGSGGYEYWHFMTRKAGETVVQLYYSRRFKNDNVDSLAIWIRIN